MRAKTIESLAWALIYSGLLILSLGLFLQRSSALFGWALVAVGAIDALAGVVLVIVRSRMKP
jgi:hypothetical protein